MPSDAGAEMRVSVMAMLLMSLSACSPPWPPMAYNQPASLPYKSCGDMAALRANLTGAPDQTPENDARLQALGVHCVADYPPPPAIRARD